MSWLPAGWRTVEVGDVITPVRTRSLPDSTTALPYIGMEHVEAHSGRVLEYGRAAGIRSSSPLVAPGDVLYGRLRPYLNKVAIAPTDAFTSGEFIVFRGNDAVDSRFLKWRLTSNDFVEFAVGLNTGDRPRVNWQQMRSFRIALPPLDEQRRIVAILEDHLSRLDAGTMSIRSATVRAGRLEGAVIDTLALSRPGAEWADPPPHDEIDDSTLPRIRSDWTWARLGAIADVVGGVTKDAKRQSDQGLVEVPYLRVANVQRGSLNLGRITTIRVSETKANQLRLLPGDVLLNEGGDRDKLGRGWIWEGQIPQCIHQNHVFRARVDQSAMNPRLLSIFANHFGSGWCQRNGKQSVNLASISLSKIKLLPIPVPPRNEQDRVLLTVEESTEAVRRLSLAVGQATTRAAALRRSLLAAAFSGQLT